MLRFFALAIGLSAVVWLATSYTGYVIVCDDTRLAQSARVTNGEWRQDLMNLPFGYFAVIPEVEGEVIVRCSDESTVGEGYVTSHWTERVKVTGSGTCENLVQL